MNSLQRRENSLTSMSIALEMLLVCFFTAGAFMQNSSSANENSSTDACEHSIFKFGKKENMLNAEGHAAERAPVSASAVAPPLIELVIAVEIA